MSTQKRQFPYYSSVPEAEIKRQTLGSINPGFEPNEPRTFEAPTPTEEPKEVMDPPDHRARKAIRPMMTLDRQSTIVGGLHRFHFMDRGADQGEYVKMHQRS